MTMIKMSHRNHKIRLVGVVTFVVFFFSSRRRHTRWNCDWSSHVCSSDLFTIVDLIKMHSAFVHLEGSNSFVAREAGPGQHLQRARHDAGDRRRRRLVRPGSLTQAHDPLRSEERRVGKECRSRWSADELKK